MPFSSEQFFGVFRSYNEAWWPAQVVLVALAVVIVALTLRGGGQTPARLVGRLIALLWAWTGIAYHLLAFTAINRAAYLFAALFLAEAALIAAAAQKGSLDFGRGSRGSTVLGAVLVTYALLLYPLAGVALGHSYPESPTFGAPCPVVIFTFGVLLWTRRRPPVSLFIIPTLWALLGLSAAASFGMWEDLALPAAALLVIAVQIVRRSGEKVKAATVEASR